MKRGETNNVINEHIKNIYAEGELEPKSTIRKFRIVQPEGKRQVARQVNFYDLDVTNSSSEEGKTFLKEICNVTGIGSRDALSFNVGI